MNQSNKSHSRGMLSGIYTTGKTQGGDPRVLRTATSGMTPYFGFTLIELLVVVLIIGVLAAIAVPQYQKAVLKSRFSSMMPTTKSIRDGNEIYYMTNGRYADAVGKLDVTATNNDEMTLAVSDDMDYAYTMATRPNIKNHLIMYQKHSLNFPGEIHCEALQGNKLANWVCETGMHGEKISGGITGGYNTYIIEGSNKGLFGAVALVSSCDKAEAMGLTCNLTTDDEGNVTQKKVCNEEGICSVIDYNEDGYKRTTCVLNANDVCETRAESTYDANGNKLTLTQRSCSSVDSNGNCTAYDLWWDNYNYTYDANGNMLTQRVCSSVDSNGNCTAYSSWNNYDYTYDANGNMTSQRYCNTVSSDGSCSAYNTEMSIDYIYDTNGNMISKRECNKESSDGSCSDYRAIYNYTYDANGNMTSELDCRTLASDGSCSQFGSNNVYYTYDTNGNRTSERYCDTVASDGSCSAYSPFRTDYTYDANGNMTSVRECSTIASDGSCAVYSNYDAFDYTYDANGNKTSQIRCTDVANDGTCRAYSQVGSPNESYTFTYDDEGNRTSYVQCKTANDTNTECVEWDTPRYD